LGLPLLLAARRVFLGARAQSPGRHQDHGGFPPLHHDGGGGRGERRIEARLRHPAHGRARGSRGALAQGLSRHGTGAHRQRRAAAGAKRQLRQCRSGGLADVL
jgi:hypothetical protein